MANAATESIICSRCGRKYSKRRGYFPACYGAQYRGTGTLSVCKSCVEVMFNDYLDECKDTKLAVRQMCRKLDLIWVEGLCDAAIKSTTVRNAMTGYITKINASGLTGKSYDDTLRKENSLWDFSDKYETAKPETPQEESETAEPLIVNEEEKVISLPSGDIKPEDVTEDMIAFWGFGYTPTMYFELEQRRAYWASRPPFNGEVDVGTEALLKQICALEIDINKARAAGEPTEKSVTTLNTLLGSANLKPNQKKDSESDASLERTPMGVWIQKWENDRPLPDLDPEFQDRDGVVRYIETWVKGHLAKMLNLKNAYSTMYEKAMNAFRVERPEFDDEDDETLFNDIFSDTDSNEGGDIDE